MTFLELITTVTTWKRTDTAADVISKELAAVRREYIGKAAWETMPTGLQVACVILAIDWVDSYGMNGGWDVRVEYIEGSMKGIQSHTSDKVLQFSKGSE